MVAMFDIIILSVAVILILMTGIFDLLAMSSVSREPLITTDPFLRSARNYLMWASVVAFIGLFLIFVLLVLTFVYGRNKGSSKFVTGSLGLFTFIIIIISGVLSIIAATRISSSQPTLSLNSYNYAIGASILSIGGLGMLILIYLFVFFLRKPKKTEPQPPLKAESQLPMKPESQPPLKPESQLLKKPESQPPLKPESQLPMKPESQLLKKPESQPPLKPESQLLKKPESQPPLTEKMTSTGGGLAQRIAEALRKTGTGSVKREGSTDGVISSSSPRIRRRYPSAFY